MERRIDRFDCYMRACGLNDNRVTNDLSLSVGTIGKSRKEGRDLSYRVVGLILNFYKDLSRTWLLTGEGSMLKDNAAVDDPLADGNVSGATHPTPGAARRHKAVGVISASGDGDASLFESIIAEKDKEILRLRVENERLKRLLSN